MKRFLIAINCVLVVLLCLYVGSYTKKKVLPNTYLGSLNLSAKSIDESKLEIEEVVNTPIRIFARDRVYNTTLSEMGVIIDDRAIDDIFESSSRARFPVNVIYFVRSLFVKSFISPPLIYTQDYYQYIDGFIFDFSLQNDDVVVNDVSKKLNLYDNEEKYRIDTNNFKLAINGMFASGKLEVKPKLVIFDNGLKSIVGEINEKIERMFSIPVKLYLEKDGKFIELLLEGEQLRGLVSMEFNKQTKQAYPKIDSGAFAVLKGQINAKVQNEGEKKISFKKLHSDLLALFNNRFDGGLADTILAKFDFHPNSLGELASKYIEVDLSQQKMYLFRNKVLLNSYRVSTGKYYPTPVGRFKILNKAVNAYSGIYNVYMPYWMAFSYASDIGAYLGIHELPYYLTVEGQTVRRPPEFIGSPNTGGCIALEVGKAQDVYKFADVDTEVFIYN